MMKHLIVSACCSALLLPVAAFSQYIGSGSVSQGIGQTTISSIYSCTGGRIPNIGSIQASDGTNWTMPAENHFQDATFPFASNLYNPCTGVLHANEAAALAALNPADIVTIDQGAELFTAYVFADNYFEMYVNGIPVGKDNVPYTQFNSDIIQFRANRPFQISMLLIDWEEHLGIGTEASGGFAYHAGDGGVVLVLKNEQGEIIATTGSDWKAQTYYTAPVVDLACLTENGQQRLSSTCVIQDSNDGTAYYGVHWAKPANWNSTNFDDSTWPAAVEYSNATVGVNNKPAYTNFTNVFDAPQNDGQFIWSNNLVLDNEVVVRYTVEAPLNTGSTGFQKNPEVFVDENRMLHINSTLKFDRYTLYTPTGSLASASNFSSFHQLPANCPNGFYILHLVAGNKSYSYKIVLQ